MSGGSTEREEDTESEAVSRLWAVSTEPNTGLEPMNREIMTQAEVGRLTDWATQAPLLLLYFFKFIYFERGGETERERAQEGQRERERETQNSNQDPGSELSAQNLMQGSNPPTARWLELKSDAQPIEPPRCPCTFFYLTNEGRGQQAFSVRGQVVNSFGCVVCTVSVTTNLCHCSTKGGTDNMETNECCCVPI